jgi:PAS domain S-box-containing protein
MAIWREQKNGDWRVIGTCHDLSEQSRHEDAVRAAYQSLVEHSLQGVTIFQNDRLVYTNPATSEITGYTHDELRAFTLEQLVAFIHPDEQPKARDYLNKWLARRAVNDYRTYRYLHPDGETRWLQIHVSPIYHQASPALQVALLDITAHKKAQQTLQRSLERVQRSQRLVLALGRAAQAVQRARTPQQVFQVVGREIVRLGYHAVVLTLEENGKHMTVSHVTYPPELIQAAERATGEPMLGYRFPLKPGGFYHSIVAGQKAVFSSQRTAPIAEARLSNPRQAADVLDIQERIAAPLISAGKVRGVLNVNGSGLREEDVPAVEAFANQAAIALESAELLTAVRRQGEELRALSAQLLHAQEEGRTWMARELHDETGQLLTAMSLNLAQIAQDFSTGGPTAETKDRLAETRALVDHTMDQIHEMVLDLRPAMLDELGLVPTLRWAIDRFTARSGIPADLSATGLNTRLRPEIETTLYRVTQEALTNVIRHAQASHVSLRLEHLSDRLHVEIQDDGVGLDVSAVADHHSASNGVGLLGMRERVSLLGGRFEIHSQPGDGTRLTIEIPLKDS